MSSDHDHCYIDNEKLIELVKKNKSIYDNTCALYKSKEHNDNVWKTIAEELQNSVDMVKLRWMALRSSFLREIRNERAYKNKKRRRRVWYLAKQMEFVRDFVYSANRFKRLRTNNSVDGDEDTDDNQSEDNNDNSNYGSETVVKDEYSDPLAHPQSISMQTIMQPQPTPLPHTSPTLILAPDEHAPRSQQGQLNDHGEQNLAFFRSIVPDILKLTERRQRLFRQTVLSALNNSLDEQEMETQKIA